MTRKLNSKIIIASAIVIFSGHTILGQDCEVEKVNLKGTYTGDCKKGKAHGKGKAIGIDTYEGEFKNGLPDGDGTYTWNNKNVFVGHYEKGLREGKGIMTFRREGGKDSVVEGYWKKDVYTGQYAKPWELISRTGSVRSVDVDFTSNEARKVKIIITTTTGGVPSTGGQIARPSPTNIVVIKGNYDRVTTLESHYKSTEMTLTEVTFPFQIKFNIGSEQVEIAFYNPGSYTANISVNQ